MDLLLMLVLALSFGLLVATHVALSAGLFSRVSPWHGVLAFALPPLALVWGFRAGMRVRALTGVAALALHSVCLIASAIGDIRS